ncbi:hypothetical protein [Streptomyces sp. NPDC002540]
MGTGVGKKVSDDLGKLVRVTECLDDIQFTRGGVLVGEGDQSDVSVRMA